MTAQQIISQIEKTFGRQPEQYMFQLINDALDDIASNKQNYTTSAITDLKKKQRWYVLDDTVIDVMRVEIKDTNDRYVMIPKLADSHKILREDTDSNNATWTISSNTTATSSTGSQGADDSLT
jgi:hypothetical protein